MFGTKDKVVYSELKFPLKKARPFFYANFVETLDGKVHVTTAPRAYWPIGSATDYRTLVELRARADALIHGKNTALWIRTLGKLGDQTFQKRRKGAGMRKPIVYAVVSAHPTAVLMRQLENPPPGVRSLLVTARTSLLPKDKANRGGIEILRLGKNMVDLKALASYLNAKGLRRVLVEGGPKLFSSFLEAGLIDEIFVTIAPKIFGNIRNAAATMAEGYLFPPDKAPNLQLISVKKISSEVYLRYRVVK